MKGSEIKHLISISELLGSNLPLMPRSYKDIAKNDKNNHEFSKFFTNSVKVLVLTAMNMHPSVEKEVEERFKYALKQLI